MNPKFQAYVIRETEGAAFSPHADKLAVFCHYDADGIVSEYVVHYVKELGQSGCDVVFVSNSKLAEDQIAKIRPLAQRIIIRRNEGYDFAAYFTGYLACRDRIPGYAQLLFLNDSVFGPFYGLAELFRKMAARDLDMWGISDAFHKHYHIQSYFWAFKTSRPILDLLDREAESYDFTLPKKHVVGRYEEGITAAMLKREFRLGVLCSNAEAVDFEMRQKDDRVLRDLKADMIRIAKSKQSFLKRIKALFSVKTRRSYHFIVPDANAYCTGINSCWYSMIRHFACPFIKVSLLKSPQNFRYHGFGYIGLLKEQYPGYDWGMIETHLNRVRPRGSG